MSSQHCVPIVRWGGVCSLFISGLALDSLSHVCNRQLHIDPCETQICRTSALGRTRWVSTSLLKVVILDTLGSSY